ncbi:hypothetical protein HTZ97_05630 [Desulfuromonas acetoxidans]|uniref:Uncharacterized protein n=1 Tax=Desulfuromonas acetoxidans (strain DSM 684 / 11070) TaxID=281689 RepID=Q1K2Z5_DESA6|nr:hypothetical protein [Desulfuromonas acetoxidans]EAT16736.1 hypothetical protein Dace_1988 [Desulfuromonas acetoxidans DSM 684]NVD23676.1 hypothetical protein [Desulfuromonas acetoxidans]NVE15939.1 hypothetical protein [Desulfuromonas acetoxidans]
MDSKTNFIVAAIGDTQAVIRAVDFKVAALLAAMLLPISSLGRIWAHVSHFSLSVGLCWGLIFGGTFLFLWLFAVLTLVRSISAIDNPSRHIVNSSSYNGSFYGGGLYEFGLLDAIVNRGVVKASKDVVSFSGDYPDCEDGLVSELTFEHMKLIYIRDVKMHRLRLGLNASFLWVLVGVIIYIVSKIS